MVITKKIKPEYFKAVAEGKKKFELRKDEDNIQVGDIVTLCEWTEEGGYTGKVTQRLVYYVLRDVPEYGLMDGYCIIGF